MPIRSVKQPPAQKTVLPVSLTDVLLFRARTGEKVHAARTAQCIPPSAGKGIDSRQWLDKFVIAGELGIPELPTKFDDRLVLAVRALYPRARSGPPGDEEFPRAIFQVVREGES